MSNKELGPHIPQDPAPLRAAPAGPILRPASPGESRDESLLGYARLLWRGKAIIVGAALAGAAASFLFSLLQRPLYRARASVEVRNLNADFLNVGKTDPTSVNYDADSYVQTQIRLLQSDSLLDRASSEVRFEPKPWSDRLEPVRAALYLPQPEPLRSRAEAVSQAMRNLKVKGTGMTRLIEIESETADPQFSADFVNELVSGFIEQSMEARWNAASGVTRWLEAELQGLREKLQRSEAQLNRYLEHSGLVLAPPEKGNAASQTLEQLQAELLRAQADRVTKQSKYELALNSPAESLPEALDDGMLRDYQMRLAELRRRLVELRAAFTPAHPDVVRTEAQLREYQAMYDRQRDNILRRIQNEYETAVRRERLLREACAAQLQRSAVDARKVTQFNMLRLEADSTRQLYDAMLERTKETAMTAALPVSNIRIVDRAKPPAMPQQPDIRLNLVLGTFFGCSLGLALAFIRERSSQDFREPGQAELHLDLAEIGAIPVFSFDQKLAAALRAPGRRVGPLRLPPLARARNQRLELVTWKHGGSVLAECYRSALTSILLLAERAGNTPPKVIVFTSPGAVEGKTTSVTNIGVALASSLHRSKRRVLLIDGDMRRPRLHGVFGIPNGSGLSDILRGDAIGSGRTLREMVRETAIPGLYVLPAGPATEHGLDVGSAALAHLFGECRREFDIVLIDTPPVITFPDARVLGRWSDAVILVVRAWQTPIELAAAARDRLRQDGTPILGTLLTHWRPGSAANRYGRHYAQLFSKYYRS